MASWTGGTKKYRSFSAAQAGGRAVAARNVSRGVSSGGGGGSSGGEYEYSQAYADAGITKAEWSSMNEASKAKVAQYAAAGQLSKAGSSSSLASPLGGSSSKSLTVVDKAGNPIRQYTAVSERVTASNPAEARVLGVSQPGTYERRTLYRTDLAGNRQVMSQEPVSSRVVKKPGLFGRGVLETTYTGVSPLQAMFLGAPPPPYGQEVGSVTVQTPIASRFDQSMGPKVGGSFTGVVARGAVRSGRALESWAGERLAQSEARSAAAGASRDNAGFYGATRFADAEPWKQARFREAQGVGGFLSGAGGTTLREPGRVVIGGAIGATFVLLTKGGGLAAGTRAAPFAARASSVAKYAGYGATAIYAADVGVRYSKEEGSGARGRVLGSEVPGLLGVAAGGGVAGVVVQSAARLRAGALAGRAVGKPLDRTMELMALREVAETGEESVLISGRRLQGVRVAESAVADGFGVRGRQTQVPIFGERETFPLGEAPRAAPYYAATGRGVAGVRDANGVQVIREQSFSRVITGGQAAGAAAPRSGSYDLTGDFGVRATFRGEAELRFSPAAGGVGAPRARSMAPDAPFYRNFQDDVAFRKLWGDMRVTEFTPSQRPQGDILSTSLRSERPSPSSSPMIFRPGTGSGRVGESSMGGVARPGAELPGYDFTSGGQRARLLFDTWEPQLKSGTKQGGPFIVEGIEFSGGGRAGGLGQGLGRGLGGGLGAGLGVVAGRQRGGFGFGFGSAGAGTMTFTTQRLGFESVQAAGQSYRQIVVPGMDVTTRQDVTTETVPATILTPQTVKTPGGGGSYDFGFAAPEVPFLPVAGALPFGFGPGRKGGGGGRGASFQTRYNPSIIGAAFNIRGSRSQGRAAALTGVAVRPIV